MTSKDATIPETDSRRFDRAQATASGTGAHSAPPAQIAPPSRTPPSDSDLAKQVMNASLQLQAAMDDAVKHGLMVEPAFEKRHDRFIGARNSYLCTVAVYRKIG